MPPLKNLMSLLKGGDSLGVQQGLQECELIPGNASIATTGNTDDYAIAPFDGFLNSVDFQSLAALAANDTNFITWTITNLGQLGAGAVVMLSTSLLNTTKLTGGAAIVANARKSLVLVGNPANTLALAVKAGDVLRIRAAASGTLAGAVTRPTYLLRFQ